MPNFKFNLSVSTTDSNFKPTPKDIAKMQYQKRTVDIDAFIQYIRKGHSFCYCFDDMDEVFDNSTKTKDNFSYTNVIAIDIDDSEICLNDYIESMRHKPTLAYTTYSNTLKGFRYRLVYVFRQKIMGLENYGNTYNGILSANGMQVQDNCMKSANQCFIGNGSNNIEIICSGALYDVSDFPFKNNMCGGSSVINPKWKKEKRQGGERKETLCLNPAFEENLSKMQPSEFIVYYRNEYPYFENSDLILSDDGTHYIFPSDYREIQRKWERKEVIKRNGERKQVRTVHILKDGERRRLKLFKAASIIKAIKPDITLEHLVYILCVERYHYYDNSDKQLTNQTLIGIAKSVMNGKYDVGSSKHGAFKVNKSYWAEMGYSANSAARIISKSLNYESIGQWYDCSKSVKENAEYAKANGIKKAGKSTLYKWCKENGIPTS